MTKMIIGLLLITNNEKLTDYRIVFVDLRPVAKRLVALKSDESDSKQVNFVDHFCLL